MRFTLKRVIDAQTVPGLDQPVSVALDSRGNLLICDQYRDGGPTVSRLVAADNYARVVLGTEAALGIPPRAVCVGPGDSLYILGRAPEGAAQEHARAVRLSGYGDIEGVYDFPAAPFDVCVDGQGKLWTIFSEEALVAMLHAYHLDGTLAFDYGGAVKNARANGEAPPAFVDGQCITTGPDGSIWAGAYGPSPDEDDQGRELVNCVVNLAPDGSWRSWHFPCTFEQGEAFEDFLGLAAPATGVLLTIARGNFGEYGVSDEFLVEIDCNAQRIVWHNLADEVGLSDLKARLFPSIADLAFRDGLLYLCDRNQSRIIVLQVEP